MNVMDEVGDTLVAQSNVQRDYSNSIKNLSKFNNVVRKDVTSFRVSGLVNNLLLTKQFQLDDITNCFAQLGLLLDTTEADANWNKAGFKNYTDDSTRNTFSATVTTVRADVVADFPAEGQIYALFIAEGRYVKSIEIVTLWKGVNSLMVVQALEPVEPIEVPVYYT